MKPKSREMGNLQLTIDLKHIAGIIVTSFFLSYFWDTLSQKKRKEKSFFFTRHFVIMFQNLIESKSQITILAT